MKHTLMHLNIHLTTSISHRNLKIHSTFFQHDLTFKPTKGIYFGYMDRWGESDLYATKETTEHAL